VSAFQPAFHSMLEPPDGAPHLDRWGNHRMCRAFAWARARLTGLFGQRSRAGPPTNLTAGEPFARFMREFRMKNDTRLGGTDRGDYKTKSP
jgi:hypothetical protein